MTAVHRLRRALFVVVVLVVLAGGVLTWMHRESGRCALDRAFGQRPAGPAGLLCVP